MELFRTGTGAVFLRPSGKLGFENVDLQLCKSVDEPRSELRELLASCFQSKRRDTANADQIKPVSTAS